MPHPNFQILMPKTTLTPDSLIDPISGKAIPKHLIHINTGKPKNYLSRRAMYWGAVLAVGLVYCLYMYIAVGYILIPMKGGGFASVAGSYCIFILAALISATAALTSQYILSKKSVFVWAKLRPIHISLNCIAVSLLLLGVALSQIEAQEFLSDLKEKTWVPLGAAENMQMYANADDLKVIMAGSEKPVLRVFFNHIIPTPDDTKANQFWGSTFSTYQIYCHKKIVKAIAQTDYEDHFDGVNIPSGHSENATSEWLAKYNQSPQMTDGVSNIYSVYCRQNRQSPTQLPATKP